MKKSNKILLGGFVAALLLLTAVHLTLYAKYRSGDYTTYNPDELQSMVMQSFPHVKFVSVRNVEQATVSFGDSVQVRKSDDETFTYVQRGDTLHISGIDSLNRQRSWSEVILNLPRNAAVQAYNSTLSFTDRKGALKNDAFVYLEKSKAHFFSGDEPLRLGTLKLIATRNSGITFDNTSIDDLHVSLSDSELEDRKGSISQLTISTDSLSRIALQAKHFSKAKSDTTHHE